MIVLVYPSLLILFSCFYWYYRPRSNPSFRIFLLGGLFPLEASFDLKALLSLCILVFLFFTVGTSFSFAFSLLARAYNSGWLGHNQPLLTPVIGLDFARGSVSVLGTQTCKSEGNHIEISAISVSAPIAEGENGQAALKEGVWLIPGSAKPGEVGNAILTGHRWTMEKQPYGDVFYRLPELSIGDQFAICYDGKSLRYEIIKTMVIEADEMEIFNPSSVVTSYVSLYTCHPLWMANKRFVAIAEEI